MEPSGVSLVLFVLSLIATLPGITMVHAERSHVSDEDNPNTSNMTKVDNQCSPLQRRQDLLDNRMTERDTRLNELHTQLNGLSTQLNGLDTRLSTQLSARQNEVNTRFNRMDSRLDGIETAISDMKDFLQERMEAMDKKVEWALTDMKPKQEVSTARPNTRTEQADTITEKPQVYRDCKDALTHGVTTSGVYNITPDQGNSINVYCEQRLDGGGWTVFQARKDGSVDFYRDWNAYKAGFGVLTGEFWLGNTNINLLTKHNEQQLKIELTSPEGEVQYADYSHFSIGDESQKYRLSVSGYSGGSRPGDALAYMNGGSFSTKDQDNDAASLRSLATVCMGAWWYSDNSFSNLNGQYGGSGVKGLWWWHWKSHVSMKGTRMMVRKKH